MPRKLITFVALFAMLIQSFSATIYLYPGSVSAQEAEVTSAEISETPTPAPAATTAVASSESPTPTEEIPPIPTTTPTPTETTATPSPSQEENLNPTVDVASPTPITIPTEGLTLPQKTGEEKINVSILENANASILDLESSNNQPSATLTTDKADYFPTDTALITGTGLTPKANYILYVSSTDPPAVNFSAEVTSNDHGSFVYAYQLDGNYRPNYQVELKDSSVNVVASTTFTDSGLICQNDVEGVNDEPEQKDLTRMCHDYTNSPTTINITWDWDEINGSGGNTYDACSLYDTDSDGFANYSVCVTLQGTPLSQIVGSPRIYSCTDSKADRCKDSSLISGSYSTICGVSQQNTDPFSAGTPSPADTVANCDVRLSEVGGSTAQLLDVCSYPSQQPNSDPSDCIKATNEKTGKLEIKKTLSPSTDLGLFNLSIDGSVLVSDVGNNGSTGVQTVLASEGSGTAHTLGESAGTGTILINYSSGVSCVLRGTSTAVATTGTNPWNINVVKDKDVVCTITNTRINNGSITIIKDVQPNDSQDFAFSTTGTGLSSFSLDDDNDITLSNTKTFSNLSSGTYSVSESTVAGWTQTSATCSDGSPVSAIDLSAGENVTCTFINTRDTGSVKVNKLLDSDGNGSFETSNPGSFNWSLDGSGTNAMGTTVSSVNTGTHSVSENSVGGYHFVGWYLNSDTSKTCSNTTNTSLPASVSVSNGQTTEITLCNAVDTGTLIVHKVTDPTDTTTQFSITATGSGTISGAATRTITGGSNQTYTLTPGSYSVSESPLAGWSQNTNDCQNLTVVANQAIECTITNTKLGQIIVVKDAVNNNAQNFTFHNNFGNGNPETFLLDDDSDNALPDTRGFEVLPGTYVLSEDTVTGWQQESATCSDGSDIGAVQVSAGETVTCTFVNEKLAKIILVKNTIGGDGVFNFSLTGNGLPTSTQLTTLNGTASQTFEDLDQDNTYSISETVPDGWDLTSGVCSGTNTPSSITPDPGETVTCTIGNTKRGSISVLKYEDLNADGRKDANEPGLSGWKVNLSEYTQTTTDTNGNILYPDVIPGTYTISEDIQDGWNQSNIVCTGQDGYDTDNDHQFTVAPGQNVSCQIANYRKGHIIVIKDVINPDGNPVIDTSTSFAFQVSGSTDAASLTDGQSHDYEVAPGLHTVTETTSQNYDFVACSGGITGETFAGTMVTVNSGETINVTCTNKQKSTTIRVYKDVLKSDGSAVDDNHSFTTRLNGQNPQLISEDDSSSYVVNPGIYSVIEDDDSDYDEQGCKFPSGANATNFEVVSGQSQVDITCTNKQNPGSISGTKYDDLGAVIGGWTIDLYSCSGVGVGCGALPIFTTFTGTDGNYTFSNLLSGFYQVAEAMETGWAYVTDWFHDVTVGVGENVVNQNFTNRGDLSITACKFEDSNGLNQGVTDTPVSNWNFTVGSVTQNTGESNCTTFSNLKPGTYTVTEGSKEGWYVADDSGGARTIVLTDRDQTVNFFNYQKGSITGTKWDDADGDSEFGEENVLSGWTIFIDKNDNETLDEGEQSTTTQENGGYSFEVDPGTYKVCEVLESGWVQTYPLNSTENLCHEVTVTSGNESSDNNFGNQGHGSIKIVKNIDTDGDGEIDDRNVSDWTWDIDGSGDFNTGSTQNVTAGSYTVSEDQKENFHITDVFCSNDEFSRDPSESIEISVDSGQDVVCTFTNTRDTGTITVEKRVNPSEGDDGLFNLQVDGETRANEVGDGGTTERIIVVTGLHSIGESETEGTSLSDYSSSISCVDGGGEGEEIATGTGTSLSEIQVNDGDDIICTITNTRKGKVIVTKYNDLNGNGELNEGEGVLSGWDINLGEQSKPTDQNGEAIFDKLLPNTGYSLSENVKAGWEQTNIFCDQRSLIEGEVQINAGQTVECSIFNHSITPVLTISKVNNAAGDLAPGSSVVYQIKVKVSDSDIKGVTVTDLLPEGFKYRAGSWSAKKNGSLFSVPEPTYASPGTWTIGDLLVGDEVVLSLTADISHSQHQGLYKDVAWAKGTSLAESTVYALATNPGNIDSGDSENRFVGTEVNIAQEPNTSLAILVNKKPGDVLGATTQDLPSTGGKTIWLVLASLLLVFGLSLVSAGYIIAKRYV